MTYKIFWIFDAQVASNTHGTHLKRRGSKFCVGWWSGDLHSSHMDPIGEKHVPQTLPKLSQSSPRASQGSPKACVPTRREICCKSSVWCRRAPTLGHALLCTTLNRIYRIYRIYRKRCHELLLRPSLPHAPGVRMTVVNKLPQITDRFMVGSRKELRS